MSRPRGTQIGARGGMLSVVVLGVASIVQGAVHQHTSSIPVGWTSTGTPPASVSGAFTIALALQNGHRLEDLLLSVSTPGSPQYGNFLDNEDLASTFGPSDEAVSTVTKWLHSGGIMQYKVDGAFIDFTADIPTVNSLLNASYQHYTANGDTTKTKLRTLSYHLPDSIESHVALIDPGIYFGSTQASRPVTSPVPADDITSLEANQPEASPSCNGYITPACLKQMYGVGNYTPDASSGSWIGFGSFLGQSAIYDDLFKFEQYYNLPHQNFSTVILANASNDQNTATAQYGEADLDIENIVGLTHPMPVVEFSHGGLPPFLPDYDGNYADQNEPYVPFYRYLLSLNKSDLPQVISQSYADFEFTVPYDYANLSCTLIGMLGLRGVSVIVGSGDWGVGVGCLAPDNKTVQFESTFPSSCPYVTSVGGTVAVSPEVAWNGSSGGFSVYFPRPSYQDTAVASYMNTVSASTHKYYGQYTNFSGRAFPDVAAHSLAPDYRIIAGGRLANSGGTSAATPVIASVVALLNDARFRAGKNSSLGFLNPLIYQYGSQVFTDVTGGYSVGCDGYNAQDPSAVLPAGNGVVPGARWNSTVGWDTTTGFGTPDFEKLRTLVLGL